MANNVLLHCLTSYATLPLAGFLVLSGCSKKTDSSTATPAATTTTAPAEPQPTEPAAQPAAGPILDASQMTGDPKMALAEADAALRQREYEKAVRTMLAVQQAQLNAQQAEAARRAMYALQRNLANAVASGDPNAKAAAELLRAGRGH